MRQVFICDAIRTPIGRYGGALAGIRPDDLGAIPLHALMQRNPRVDWAAVDDVYLRLRQPGRRGQSQRRAHGGAAGRPAGRACPARRSTACAAPGSMPSISPRARFAPARAELVIAGGVESMTRAPFVMAKADSAFSRDREDRGHDDRLALRQSADEGEVRHRLDAGDRRERRRGVQRRARRPGRVRAAQPAALRARACARTSSTRDRARVDSAEEGRAGQLRSRRASARGHDARSARQAERRRASRTAR